jgi:hypothetical protein
MDFDSYKHICFTHGIHPEIIEECRDFINEHDLELDSAVRWNKSSLGYAELGDIETPEQSIRSLIDCIQMSTLDYDALGRSKQKVLMKKFRKDPGKHFRRLVLKSFYLHDGKVS